MRNSIKLALGASALALAAPANSAVITFSSGDYGGPSVLNSPDILQITTSANKSFNAVSFSNVTGTVDWQAGNLFLANGAMVTNQSLWDVYSNVSLVNGGGALSMFQNTGIFRQSAGTSISISNAFTNSGSIEALTGTITFNGGNAVFNAGSQFLGAGTVAIGNDATFNGDFASQNLRFTSGTFSGNGAILNGTANYASGTFTGDWEVANGSTFSGVTSANKSFNAVDFVNNGTVDWQSGNLFLSNGSAVTNNGQYTIGSNLTIANGGGALSTFTNSATGTLTTAGGAAASIGTFAFVNNGGTITSDGTLTFNGGNATFNAGTVFDGAGTTVVANDAAFNGAFSSQNLVFTGGTFTGTGAVLNGSATYNTGAFSGGWQVANGSTFSGVTSANKSFNAVDFVNNGTVDWQSGNLFLSNGSAVTNNGQYTIGSNLTIANGGGALSTFTNSATGTLTTAGGAAASIGTFAFVNNGGTITSDGTLTFNGGNATFNAGTVFDGAGTTVVANDAAFNGAFSSQNLVFTGGTFTGTGAILNGSATYNTGSFTGGWQVANGSTFTGQTSSNKSFNAVDFVNNGTVEWQSGNLFLSNGSTVTNNGQYDIGSNLTIANGGGAASSFVNNGLLQKTGGSGTTTIGVGFDNNGTMNVQSGTIALPSNFVNDGTMAGTGTYSVSGTLTNNGTIAPGDLGMTGTLSLTGSYAQTASGALASQLFSMGSFDRFNISGMASLDGLLALSCLSGCAVQTGDTFVLLDSVGALSGVFSNVTTSGFGNGFQYDLIYDYDNDLVRLTVLDAGVFPGGVPEPSTWALLILGFGTIGGAMRRKRVAFRLA